MNWLWVIIGIYLVGFVVIFLFNINIGPVTLALSLLRALFWPIWIATGWPYGEVGGF